ncbi:lipid A biosynthesis acyltransferase [Puteibacter caeruleilacunae]|nr:lipid A biosynthesis acyltransferase [Puteibacter caeruleilacunae]
MGNFLYFLMCGAARLMQLFPLRFHYLVSDIFYFLMCYVVRYRKKVIIQNLRNSFPEKSDAEILKITKKYYTHLCDVFIETFYLAYIPEKEMRKRVVVLNPEEISQYHKAGRSTVAVLGHYANWEWMTATPLYIEYPRFHYFYKRLKSEAWDRFMLRLRSRMGATLTEKDNVFRLLIGEKQKGNLNCSGFLADQAPKANMVQYWTTFLNQDTAMFLGAEKVALKTNSPVVFGHMNKIKRGYYEVELTTIIKEPSECKKYEITEAYTRILEEKIKQRPELWMWSHKRWKYKKETTSKTK